MTLIVNGEGRDCNSRTLADLIKTVLDDLDIPDATGFAMALNGAIVRREKWNEALLADGDKVEIVRARQGG